MTSRTPPRYLNLAGRPANLQDQSHPHLAPRQGLWQGALDLLHVAHSSIGPSNPAQISKTCNVYAAPLGEPLVSPYIRRPIDCNSMVHCALAVFAESQHDRYLLTPLLLTLIGFPGAAPKLLLTLFRKISYGFTSAKFLSLTAVRSQGRRLIKSLISNPIANVRIFTIVWSTAAGSSSVRFKRQPLVALAP